MAKAVGLRARRAYVVSAMNLLLLLSALISALTGVGGGARAPQPAAAAVSSSVAMAASVAVRSTPAATRPATVLPRLIETVGQRLSASISLVAHEPIFASRRRE